MPAVLAAATSSNWNAGGSVLTFYFPVGLFLVVAAILCLQFTRPHTIPGRRPFALARPSANGPAADTVTVAAADGDANPVPPSDEASGSGHDGSRASGAEDDLDPPTAGA